MVKYILRSGKPLKRKKPSGCGSAWLERLIWDQEVAGSNPVTPTNPFIENILRV